MANKWDRIGVWTAILVSIAGFGTYLGNQTTAIALNTEYITQHKLESGEGFVLIGKNHDEIQNNGKYIEWMYAGMVAAGLIPEMHEL